MFAVSYTINTHSGQPYKQYHTLQIQEIFGVFPSSEQAIVQEAEGCRGCPASWHLAQPQVLHR